MATKITLTLNAKADHDLLVRTLERRRDDLRKQLDDNIAKPPGERMNGTDGRMVAAEHMALETLLREVS